MNPYCLQFTLITDLITGQQEDKASILTVGESNGERWLAGSGFRVTLGDVDINTLTSA